MIAKIVDTQKYATVRKTKMRNNEVFLEITSWIGTSMGAQHYYGKLVSRSNGEYESVSLKRSLTTKEARNLSKAHDWTYEKGHLSDCMVTKDIVRNVAISEWKKHFPKAEVLREGNPAYVDDPHSVLDRTEKHQEDNTVSTGEKMKVKLLMTVPVNAKYGLTKGKEIELEKMTIDGVDGWWCRTDYDPVKILPREYERID